MLGEYRARPCGLENVPNSRAQVKKAQKGQGLGVTLLGQGRYDDCGLYCLVFSVVANE